MLQSLFRYLRCDLALDLGTANTLVGVVGEGIVLDEPSVIAVDRRSGRILAGGCAVGHLAKQMEGRTPESIAVVRPMACGVIADFELCEAMLRYFLAKALGPGFRLRPRILVTVPGCITRVEKRAVFNSLHRAGAGQVYLVSEAKAAAVGAGLPLAEPVANMVCDIGGGTTEVGVFSMADSVAVHSVRVGGDRMDQALVDYLRRHYSLRVGLATAERLRIEIGSAVPREQERVEEIRGLDAVSGLPRQAVITSEEVRQALNEPLDEILEAIKNTLDRCSPELASDLVENGLMLCGGGAMLAGLDRFITEQTGLPARTATEPLTTVARGALICMEHLDRWRGAIESSDDDV